MVKANELRIGNLVNAGAGAYENEMVVGITPREIITINGLHWDIDDDLIDPIPLTPEILEKCEHQDYRFSNGTFGGLIVSDAAGDNEFYIKIEYVHQLQNLYFALTGTELEINLTEKD